MLLSFAFVRPALACLAAAVLLSACDNSASGEPEPPSKAHDVPVVQTAPLAKSGQAPRLTGNASVLNPDALIQADADIRTARLAAEYSGRIFARAQTLLKSSVAVSKQTFETAQRQSEADAVQLKLLENRLQEVWGRDAPFLAVEQRSALISALSQGHKIIVRADIAGSHPGLIDEVELSPLAGGAPVRVDIAWPAPSGNLAMPGVSYFAIASASPGLRAGDRAMFSAVVKTSTNAITIPRSAIVIAQGAAWCFVQNGQESYTRRPVTLDTPVDEGYQVADGFAEGENVVVRGAAMLLARESDAKDGSHE